MTSALNKRQQARNERALHELIKQVSGNDRCADCEVRNPGWASWNLGIFLCMRCASLHRKLGTHVTKVKSLSMDSWNNDQVDNMKRIGNVESNRQYNPRNVKPSIPVDVDEVDGAMERFIRQKYDIRIFMTDSRPGTRQNTGSSSSMEDRPPPLPPKPTKRFGLGLRSTSFNSPSSRSDRLTPPVSPGLGGYGHDSSPPRVNKPSRIFGSNVISAGDSFESKLITLKDMGFSDEKRNATVLKSLNGNLDRAVEALIRLGGDGSGRTSRVHTPAPPQTVNTNVNGISIERKQTPSAAAKSTNPFDRLDNMPTQSQQGINQSSVTPTPVTASPVQATNSNGYNPFLPQPQQIQQLHPSFEQSFQNLGISQPPQQSQTIIPQSTGGYGNTQMFQNNPYQQAFTPPPVPQVPSQYLGAVQASPQSASPNGMGNPFLRSSRSQIFSSSNPYNQTSISMSPAPQMISPPQQQLNYPQKSASAPLTQNPFIMGSTFNQSHSDNVPNAGQFQQNPYSQPQQQSLPYRHDKTSILALYNNPYLVAANPGTLSSAPTTPSVEEPAQPMQMPNQNFAPAQRSVTMPVTGTTQNSPFSMPPPTNSGNMNLFAVNATAKPATVAPSPAPSFPVINKHIQPAPRHISHESVDFTTLVSGRHSPDAFTSLSARFVQS